MIATKKQIQDAARFSNFCQKFKTIVWDIEGWDIEEKTLDDIAIALWAYLEKEKK